MKAERRGMRAKWGVKLGYERNRRGQPAPEVITRFQSRERECTGERDTGGWGAGNEWDRPDFLEVIPHFRCAFVPQRPPLEGL